MCIYDILWYIYDHIIIYTLVGGLEHDFYFSIYWECHHPNWRTPSFFRGVGIPPLNHQPDMYLDVSLASIWCGNFAPFLEGFTMAVHGQLLITRGAHVMVKSKRSSKGSSEVNFRLFPNVGGRCSSYLSMLAKPPLLMFSCWQQLIGRQVGNLRLNYEAKILHTILKNVCVSIYSASGV